MRAVRPGLRGFTLVELMIVVAVMGALAAIAIPNFLTMQLRAKRAELPINVDGIRNAERAYEQEFDAFTSCEARPTTIPGRSLMSFGHVAGDKSDWDLMGWVPDGMVRGQYQVVAVNASNVILANFTATGKSDVDVNNQICEYAGSRLTHPVMVTDPSFY